MSAITSDIVTDADREIYRTQGAGVLRNVIGPQFIESMLTAIEEAIADEGAPHFWLEERKFYDGLFHWTRNSTFAHLIFQSRLAEIAAALLDARQINFFYDHLFVKEPGTTKGTAWHIDADYHPVAGGQHLTLWIPFDRVTPDSGVLTYIARSHLWSDAELHERLERLPKPGEAIEGEQLMSWTLEPGDILFHHARAVHGARGNLTTRRRHAVATRWLDQDARYQPDSYHDDIWALLRQAGQRPPEVDVAVGQPFNSKLFPRVWPR